MKKDNNIIKFRNRLLLSLRNISPNEITAIGKDDYIQFYKGKDLELNANLHDVIEEYQTGKNIDEIALELTKPLLEYYPGKNFTLKNVQSSIYPVIKQPISDKELDNSEIGYQLVYTEGLIADLYVEYIIERNNAMFYITNNILDILGIDKRVLHNIAIMNLKKHSQPDFYEFKNQKRPFIYSATLDGYDASRMLTTDFNRIKSVFKNGILIGIPNRDFLIIFEEGTPFELFARNQVKNDYNTKKFPISPYIYQWNGQKFIKNNK